jgi:hypothetical protein
MGGSPVAVMAVVVVGDPIVMVVINAMVNLVADDLTVKSEILSKPNVLRHHLALPIADPP